VVAAVHDGGQERHHLDGEGGAPPGEDGRDETGEGEGGHRSRSDAAEERERRRDDHQRDEAEDEAEARLLRRPVPRRADPLHPCSLTHATDRRDRLVDASVRVDASVSRPPTTPSVPSSPLSTAKLESFLAQHHETPFLVVDLDVVAERYRQLADALPAARIFYA